MKKLLLSALVVASLSSLSAPALAGAPNLDVVPMRSQLKTTTDDAKKQGEVKKKQALKAAKAFGKK